MADVWKSNPRHFCEFCKCWIADNKPSREFHESGKRHQENVKLRIKEVRKKAVEKEKQEDAENSYFAEMERNARKAFMKDLKKNPALADEIPRPKIPRKSTEESSTSKQEDNGKKQPKDTKGTWHTAFSDEGYPYYWNDVTKEVTWIKPDDYKPPTHTGGEEDKDSSNTTAQNTNEPAEMEEDEKPNSVESSSSDEEEESENSTEQNEVENNVTEDSKDETTQDSSQEDILANEIPVCDIPLPGQIPINKKPEEAEPPAEENPPISKEEEQRAERNKSDSQTVVKPRGIAKRPHTSAYGSWETIQEEEQVDLQLPDRGDNIIEQKIIVPQESKFKFKEKKVDPLGAGLVAFKNRKQASRSLKPRTTDS